MSLRESTLEKSVDEAITDSKLNKQVIEDSKMKAKAKISNLKEIPKGIEGIDKEGFEKIEYLLVQEYLESLGLTLSPTALRYESQHPEIHANRRKISKELNLNAHDRAPLLVQLISERLAMIKDSTK